MCGVLLISLFLNANNKMWGWSCRFEVVHFCVKRKKITKGFRPEQINSAKRASMEHLPKVKLIVTLAQIKFLPAPCVHVQRSAQPRCIYYRPSSTLVLRWDPAPKPHSHTQHTARCPESWGNAGRMGECIRYIPYLDIQTRMHQIFHHFSSSSF